ncbi:MAG: amino acid adenylation domain-containing protein, partial [Bacteroidales bacterium]|nr:amino acid adenylation domain-containing protein [Bacteroidales bacterium]
MVSQIHKELDVRLELREIFEFQTIEAQGKVIDSTESSSYFSIPKAKIKEYYPLSSSQQRLYLLQQMDLGSTAYNMPGLLAVPKGHNKHQITDVFNKLIARHENFRTSFEFENEIPVQRIHSEVTFSIKDYQITKSEISNIKEDFTQAFNLSQVPLLRVAYLEISDGDDMLLVDMHHIISDGRSHAILEEDFHQLIEGKELEPLSLQYKDYSEWQNSPEQQERINGQETYWLDQFKDELSVLELPVDYTRPVIQSYEGASVNFVLSPEGTKIIHEISKEQGLTLYMSLLSIFTILLSKLSGQDDIIVGSPIAARRHSDLDDIVGMFVNTLAIRSDVSGDKRLIDYLQKLKENTLEAYENQEYQFEDLVEKLVVNRDASRNPLFDVMFNLLEGEFQEEKKSSNQELNHIQGISKFDLSLTALDLGSELQLSLEYSTKLFTAETIDRFIKYFKQIVNQLPENIEKNLSSLEIITEAEKQLILKEFNDTQTDFPDKKTIHELFIDQVKLSPTQLALKDKNISYSYQELDEASNKLANCLQLRNLKSDQFVGLITNRSIEMIVGILGILKSGCAYIPIDDQYPAERINQILSESGINLIVSTRAAKLDISFSREIILIDSEEVQESRSDIDIVRGNSQRLAYVMYTSGSTGQPKGVEIEHKSVVRLVKNTNYVSSNFAHIILLTGAPVFDATSFEIWVALLNGGSIFISDKDVITNAVLLGECIRINSISTLWLTSSLFNQLVDSDETIFDSLAYLLVGGDVLSVKHISKIRNRNTELAIINGYGPTENTTFSTTFRIEKEYNSNIPIGKPISNSTAYIFNRNNQLQPIGVAGELLVGGDGLARGYLNDKDLTSEKFIVHPFTEGARLYKTGDLARWLPDGNIEFLGRIDQQVKIRGFRIELGEIETSILNYTEVKECVVLCREDQGGDKYLCAYVVSNTQENDLEQSLRLYLSGKLPDYMLPSYFVELEEMPLTDNGKLNRKSLLAPEIKAGAAYEAPKTLIENKLVKIWSEVLSIASKEISTNVSFFELGGHSLKATVLVSRIHKELDVQLELRDIFKYQSIQAQSEFINSSESTSFFSIPKAKTQEYYPLSSSQRRLYLLQQMNLESTVYNMPGLLAVPAAYNKHQITDVFNKLIARHENFRTSFEFENEIPVQRIHSEVAFSIKEYQITKSELSNIKEDFVKAFDLSLAPLLRVGYLEISDGDDMLLIDMHHIISDGRSHAILEEDFSQLLAGKELEPLHLQYKDYSQWQNSKEQQERIKGQESYWLDKFTGELPVLELPTDSSRPAMQSFEGASVGFVLSPEETKIIHDLCKDQGLTLYMSLLSIFTILLSKLSGQEDIIVGSPIAARRHADLEDVVGMFVNTLAIRSDVSGEKGLIDYLQELKENTLEAYENQEYQFEDLVEQLVVNRDVGRNPIFDVMFNLLEGESQESTVSTKEELKHIPGVSKFDLSLTALDLGSELQLSFSYNTTLFSSETIERFINYFRQLIQSLSSNLDQTIKELNILSDVEKQQLLYGFNQTKAIYPHDRCIHELIEEQVELSPDSIALVFKNQTLSYRELNLKSNQLAKILLSKGLQPGDIVGILVDRSIEMIIGIVGILKAGGAYLPMDLEYPNERINYIIRESGLFIILSQVSAYRSIEFEGEFLDLYDLSLYVNNKIGNINKGKASDSAYIIYTSGSTGKPKGVIIDHRNVVNLVNGLTTNIYNNYQEILHVSLISPIFFDASVKQIFTSLTLGHSLNIIPKSIRFEASELVIHYAKYGIQILDGTPFLAQMLIQCDDEKLQGLSIKQFILGGDELKLELMQSLFLKLGIQDLMISNVYGPTECTDVTTVQTNTLECLNQNTNVSIGKPISNYEIYILGKEGQIQAIGLFGELCISGEGLARGYLNNPELTLEKFIEHPYKTGERLYKTGDLARWLPNGDIEFLGRIDHQVKIRGFRIELGEIENILLKYGSIKECVVLAIKENGDKFLCAYVVCENEFKQENLRNYLSGLLPDYMIPSYFIVLDSIPLTSNGKVDRKSLPSPEIKAGSGYVAPKTLIETKLVKIWSEVLNVASKEISTNASFFELGGHSLKATVLVSHIHKELEVQIELRDVFQHQTIQSQSELINLSESTSYFSIPKAEPQEFYHLSSSQLRLYLIQQMDLGSTVYNMPGLITVPKGHDKHQIEDVFNRLITRHENFRMSFEVEDEFPVQRIHSEVLFSIKEYQITKAELSGVREGFKQAFDLSVAPLLRVGYLEISDGDDMLLVDMHHIISDGRSHSILEEEFYQLIDGKDLEPLRLQYKDYSEWQNSSEQQSLIKGQESYWLDKFGGELPVLELPTDYSRPVMQDFEGASVGFILSAEETKTIHDLCKEQGLTIYMSLLSIFTILLSKLSGQEDIIVGSPIAARRHADLEDVVGMFVNTLAIRNDVSGEKRLIDYLQELKENTLEAYENQEYQFEDLVDKVAVSRDIARNPLFDVMFNLLEAESQESTVSTKEELIHTQGVSKFDLSLTALDLGSELELSFEYSTKLFESETIDRFIRYFKQIINQLSDKLEKNLSIIEIITEEEKQQLLYDFNDIKIDYPKEKTIYELFEDQVEKSPDNIVLTYDDKNLSFEQLNKYSNYYALNLLDQGAKGGEIIGIIQERSLNMIIGILAILKAGCTYCPINPETPQKRIQFILKECNIKILIAEPELVNKDPKLSKLNCINLNSNNIQTLQSGIDQVLQSRRSKDISSAYIIFTSGSTGNPKGVIINHSNIFPLLYWGFNYLRLD